MAVDRRTPAARQRAYPSPTVAERLTGGGTAGNGRLTAATGATLIVLLAVIGVTILRIRPLLSVHLFVGMVLIPPVLLKLSSTGYRFARYYMHNPAYMRKGPPAAALRVIAPVVVISTLVVLASGVALLLIGPSSRDTLMPIHKVSFFVWVAFTAMHVLGHLVELPDALRSDFGRSAAWSGDVTGRSGRVLALSGALVAGVVVAIVLVPDFAVWVHSAGLFHHDG